LKLKHYIQTCFKHQMPKAIHNDFFTFNTRPQAVNSSGVISVGRWYRATLPCHQCIDPQTGVETTYPLKEYQDKHLIFRDNRKCSVIKSGYTILDPNYYNTHADLMRARCQTYEQRNGNFSSFGANEIDVNMGLCHNTNANCKKTIYKPNNPQFSTQGGVSSSHRIMALKQQAISSGNALANKNKQEPCIKKKTTTGVTKYHCN